MKLNVFRSFYIVNIKDKIEIIFSAKRS